MISVNDQIGKKCDRSRVPIHIKSRFPQMTIMTGTMLCIPLRGALCKTEKKHR